MAGRPSARWPTGHVGWVFSGIDEFEGRATTFLAEGARRRERMMFVADDPRADQWPARLLARGDLIVVSTSEVYGVDKVVDADTQRRTFATVLAEALSAGYTGIRVAADNTRLIAGPERLEGWIRWEAVADDFIAENPFTALCCFDRTRAEAEVLRQLQRLHPVTVA